MRSVILQQWRDNCRFLKKSYAQVEALVGPHVSPPKSSGLKPLRKQSESIKVRLTAKEKAFVKRKAEQTNLSMNAYIKAVSLGSDYKAPFNPVLEKALLMLNRELTAHGRNLNQIAKRLNAGLANEGQTVIALEAIRRPLVEVLQTVKLVLVRGMPQP